MKIQKSEIVYLILTIIVLAFASGVYLLHGRQYADSVSTDSSAQVATTSSSSKSSDSSAIEKAIAELEKNPSQEAYDAAKKEVDAMTDEDQKATLQARLAVVKIDLDLQQTAEDAVAELNTNRSIDLVDSTQTAINAVTSDDKRAELQAQFDQIIAEMGVTTDVAAQ